MTPRQRRNHIEALGKAASAPRKSWLGKSMLLTSIQSAWIKSLLTTWGDGVSGGTAPRLPRAHACWDVLKGGRWSDKALSRFTAALEQARAEGFRGPQALNRAHAILWPQPATSIIDEAMHNDDVDFVEQSVLQALDVNDPVYIVGLQYYTTRKKISDITRELQSIAPWLTDWEARKRVRWCLEIFRAKVFLSTRKLMAEQS
ncbi:MULTISPECIES: hypothetical protein [Enterobacter cloacae complex]|uniref:Uncharacterized protein n=2 Tax=Enterobacter hormaechei TaxID=158836 RepID=A0A822WJF9_9ENTR|nr:MULTISPECIES: hypothetical protein [Enterobacter cloacae complex]AVU50255.1 hypothetical protein AXJ76_09250 [Enterobacter cloacae]EHE7810528.1 hypothetical protein [Enterobacter hormaechei]EHF3576063.1 hypothetical protein [Enterobacter hormaechei]EKT9331882.1 hypothetical protein [Enterobacter hormaechei]KJL73187.1 hypothetical protein SS38_03105 [Enterobacter hormaechei subsp. xiangfangensis]